MQPEPVAGVNPLCLSVVSSGTKMTSGAGQFRRFAETCLQMARDETFASHRDRLVEMAATWKRLAEEADRFEKMIREMDESFEPPRVREPQRQSH
jgi:hypothetical protein